MKRLVLGLCVLATAACGPQTTVVGPMRAGPVPHGDWVGVLEAQFAPAGDALAADGLDAEGDELVGIVETGGPKAVTPATIYLVDWAWGGPDHLLVAYTDDDVDAETSPVLLRLYGLDGKPSRDVATSMELSILDIAGDPGGTRAVASGYPTSAWETTPGIFPPNADLFEVDLRTGAVRALTDTPDLDEIEPVALASGAVAYTTRPEPGDFSVVLHPPGGPPAVVSLPTQVAKDPVANATSQALLYRVAGDKGGPEQPPELWAAPLAGGPPWKVLEGKAVAFPTSLSPDGRFVAVTDTRGPHLLALPPGWDRPPAERTAPPTDPKPSP